MAQDGSPILIWFRRDLRLSDNPALHAACATGRPVIPVFVWDEVMDSIGAAARWRMGRAVEKFSSVIKMKGSVLTLRKGRAADVIPALLAETGAGSIHWTRAYDPASVARDKALKSKIKSGGVEVRSFAGHLVFEPWEVQTGAGGFYKVYSPFWRNLRDRAVAAALPAPGRITPPNRWPKSENLDDWGLSAGVGRGAEALSSHARIGEAAAQDRLAEFTSGMLDNYDKNRDFLQFPATSGLSENLTCGEISARQCWHAGQRALATGDRGSETFLRELAWREFSYHLMFHTPHIIDKNWREGWEAFPWNTDPNRADIRAWQQARTGIPLVDAGLREMYVTGKMHNRARMVVASFLTKHLLSHWKIGADWFADCLTDWDPAANAMGWQWVAGCGPDAAPYFRIFNPETQAAKFDPQGVYRARWIAEGQRDPMADALQYFDAIPRAWGLSPDKPYPAPVVDLKAGRAAALAAYAAR